VRPTFTFALPVGTVTFAIAACSEAGSVRPVNEDSYIADAPVFIVADGMGGHDRGDRASQTVAAVLRERLLTGVLPTPADVLAAIRAANDAVRSLVGEAGEPLVSGATLSGMVLVGADAGVATHWMTVNVGDSRLYTWDGRTLEQLTVDHSAVQELLDAGVITEAAARVHPERNIVTRAVGATAAIEPDVWLIPVLSSETFLICSDGLTKELTDTEIAAVLSANGAEAGVAQALVDAANAAGGQDNITAVVVRATLSGMSGGDLVDTRLAEMIDHDTTPRI
jgi:PPM family protein phosphatase